MPFILFDEKRAENDVLISLGSQKKYISEEMHKKFFVTISDQFEDRYDYQLTVDGVSCEDEIGIIQCLDALLIVALNDFATFIVPKKMAYIDRFIIANFVEKYLTMTEDDGLIKKLREGAKIITSTINSCNGDDEFYNYLLFNSINDIFRFDKTTSWFKHYVTRASNMLCEAVGMSQIFEVTNVDKVNPYFDINTSSNKLYVPSPCAQHIIDNELIRKIFHKFHTMAKDRNLPPRYNINLATHPEAYHCLSTYQLCSDKWFMDMIKKQQSTKK